MHSWIKSQLFPQQCLLVIVPGITGIKMGAERESGHRDMLEISRHQECLSSWQRLEVWPWAVMVYFAKRLDSILPIISRLSKEKQ